MLTDNRKYCLAAFWIGLAVFIAAVIPYVAQNGMVFCFYGDFNAQQVPFTLYLSGNYSVPQYDFNAGTGLDFLDAYSFYNLFSPFMLIMALVPQKIALYALPFVIALKFGVCGLNSYLYASRFCGDKDCALIAAVLYTFSGFQLVNLVFHYLDALAFFPLLLYSLELAVTEKRRGFFGIAVALCAFVNYYIFVIEVIFIVIYFLVRLSDENFRIGFKDFLCLAAESVLGAAAAGFVLVPAIVGVSGNPRFGDAYSLSSPFRMLFYETPWRYTRIIQSIFMAPEIQGYTNIFPDFVGGQTMGSRWSSQSMYLPMFGMSGVIAYMCANRKSVWARLAAICAVIAFVPILNSLFTLGRTTYYARWMFAPTLVMSVMTALALENKQTGIRLGAAVNVAVVLAIAAFSIIFPIERLTLFKVGAYYSNVQKWTLIIITLVGLALTAAIKFDEGYAKKTLVITVGMSFFLMESTILFGIGETQYPSLAAGSFEAYPEIEQTSYGRRVSCGDWFCNRNLLWGESSLYFFNSSVNPYIYEYCEALGMDYSEIYSDYVSECLCSVEYVILSSDSTAEFSDRHTLEEQQGIYYIFENPDFIPMGFCYSYCISRERFDSLDENIRKSIMLKVLVVEDTAEVSDYLQELPESEIREMSDDEISSECEKRRENYADSFTSDGSGFTAEITLEESELVFFSAAYSDNFTAYVDGCEVKLYNANIGFMAVPVQEGTHTVRLEYHSAARSVGAYCSAVGGAGLVVYIAAAAYFRRRRNTEV